MRCLMKTEARTSRTPLERLEGEGREGLGTSKQRQHLREGGL